MITMGAVIGHLHSPGRTGAAQRHTSVLGDHGHANPSLTPHHSPG